MTRPVDPHDQRATLGPMPRYVGALTDRDFPPMRRERCEPWMVRFFETIWDIRRERQEKADGSKAEDRDCSNQGGRND